jgi:BirA family transcriptional regulator, biotin operon repressor / biotin---[acetyl-CoA-carboxylase] ligase
MEKTAPTHWRILRLLKERKPAWLSGAALAAQMGLSRTGIWKQIRHLISLGYQIESHPKEGYRLLAVPNLLIPEEILPDLLTVWLAKSYHHFRQTTSTNEVLLRLASEGAPNGTAVTAEEQVQGRGRLRREWISPPGDGIYVSLLLTTPLPVMEAAHATSVAALALVKTLRSRYALPAEIKWPNDVLLRGKKLVGILTEMQSDQDYARFLVVGIGINVNQSAKDFEGPFRYPATSVALEAGHPISRQELLLDFLQRFEILYDLFLEQGFAALAGELEEASTLLGKSITVHRGKEEIRGKALRFSPEGALIVLTEEGREEYIWVGDVTRVEGTF